jgi:hypothetical protein
VKVEGQLFEMSAAEALVDASEGAELLVVGCRGRGSLAATLLGSVSTACIRHARCPVVVVRAPLVQGGTSATARVPEEAGDRSASPLVPTSIR